MKIDKPVNENYAAIIIRIKNINILPNCDNVVGVTIFGQQAIVNKDIKVGDVGIFFPSECQLSNEYCYENNLYRFGEKNKNESQKGYIENSRRIKAIKFRGHLSSCLFMPLNSLNWTKVKLQDLKEGDTFDFLNGKEICKKYLINPRSGINTPKSQIAKFNRVDEKFMPEHVHTEHLLRYLDKLDLESDVVITQKLHGTSIRIGNTIIKRRLNIFERILNKIGIKIQQSDYDYIYGSRKVIKDINNPYQNHFYGEDLYTQAGSKLKGLLPENYLVFGELIGYTSNNVEIQKNYSYELDIGTNQLFIYRVAIVNPKGILFDLNSDQMKQFCKDLGLNTVPELWRGKLKDLKIENFLEKRYFDDGFRQALHLGDNKDIVDEGIVVRVEKLRPEFYKIKSQTFLLHESKLLDEGVEDLESMQDNS